MFKRKPIYIIFLIIFTLLLCADIVGYSLTASSSSSMSGMPSNFPTDGQSGFNGAMPEASGSDSSAAMPETSGSSSNMPGNFDPTQMQGGPGGKNMAGRTSNDSFLNGLVSFIANWWIPIGILCILMDAFCVFMLIRISKKRKLPEEYDTDEAADTIESKIKAPQLSGYEKRRRKRRRTIKIVIIIGTIIVAIILGYIIIRSIYLAQVAEAETVKVVSAKAASSEIDTVISGTGTLTDADSVEITVPGGVEIDSYSVENGDEVAEGDILATVDHTSVMTAIEDLQNAMDELDQDINDASSDEISSKMKASVDGRVKVIYAEEDVSVADTMYKNGALMLISLDGLMAVDINTDADVSTGDSVTVTLSDGTELTGRVDSYVDGTATITVTDDGTAYGDNVTILDKNGNKLGAGTLYIHSELKVTGYSGTVAAVKCDEEDEVSAGETLLTLTDTEYSADYELLLEKRSDYEDEMTKLFKLYNDGNIYAEYAGTVFGVDEDSIAEADTTDTAETDTTGTAEADATDITTADATGTTDVDTTSTAVDLLVSQANSGQISQVDYLLASNNTGLSKTILLGNNPTGADDATVAGYTNYVGKVSSVSYGSISMLGYPNSVAIADYSNYSSLGITTDMMTVTGQISPSSSTPVYMYSNGAWKSYSISNISAGDVLILTYGQTASDDTGSGDTGPGDTGSGDTGSGDTGSGDTGSGDTGSGDTGSGDTGSGDTGSGDTGSDGQVSLVWIIIADKAKTQGNTPSAGGSGGSSANGSSEETSEETEEVYTITETTVMSITPDDLMSVTITIDELDILSLKVGQEATITLDAITEETFTGTVTDIDITGTNSGGSTKFTAIVTLDRTDQMLAGMNAAVSIILSSAECDVTLPVASLMESASGVFVYTSFDEENETPGDPVYVTTGLSDGTNVQILSGIDSDAEVWYEYNDTIDISSSVVSSSSGGGFNLMGIFGGGGRR